MKTQTLEPTQAKEMADSDAPLKTRRLRQLDRTPQRMCGEK